MLYYHFLAITSFGFSISSALTQDKTLKTTSHIVSNIPPIYPHVNIQKLIAMLQHQAPSMNPAVINKVAMAFKCTHAHSIARDQVITVIDYSLPSNQKRLWIFDLAEKKLLFNTYVSHGIKSGALLTNYFSNKYNSKASSLGVYKTDKAYYGREGLSLRLEGLERSFNDNAMNRAIVMHGGWYMDEGFIKKYGRPGRSWGCPAIPLSLYQPIINTIKENSLLIVYYPSDEWFDKSKFLTCEGTHLTSSVRPKQELPQGPDEHRGEVFFAQINKGGEDKPILVMPAIEYEKVFHTHAPLVRMLRRQINKEEYIALNKVELNQVILQNLNEGLQAMCFVIPTLHNVRGYYETQMKIVHLGAIRNIRPDLDSSGQLKSYTVSFNTNLPLRLQPTDKFIRWLGL